MSPLLPLPRLPSPAFEPPPCICGRCSEIISECRLENSPGSRDPPIQGKQTDLNLLKVTTALRDIPSRAENGEEHEEEDGYSKRKSEVALHESWECIHSSELKPLSPWVLDLPRWARDDSVLLQMLGLGVSSGETVDQRCRRIQIEREREPLSPPSGSPTSTFTSYDTDTPESPALLSPDNLYVKQKNDGKESDHKAGKDLSHNILSLFTDIRPVYKTSRADRIRSNDTMLKSRPGNDSRTNDDYASRERGLTDHFQDSCVPKSSNYPFGKPLPLLPSSSCPEITESIGITGSQSLATESFQGKEYRSESPGSDSDCLLHRDPALQSEKATCLGLNCTSNTITPITSSTQNQVIQRAEWKSSPEIFSYMAEGENSFNKVPRMPTLQLAKASTALLQKRKRNPQDTFPPCSTSTFTDPSADILRPRKRPRCTK